MIRIFNDNKHICECCDNDSIILIDFTEEQTVVVDYVNSKIKKYIEKSIK